MNPNYTLITDTTGGAGAGGASMQNSHMTSIDNMNMDMHPMGGNMSPVDGNMPSVDGYMQQNIYPAMNRKPSRRSNRKMDYESDSSSNSDSDSDSDSDSNSDSDDNNIKIKSTNTIWQHIYSILILIILGIVLYYIYKIRKDFLGMYEEE